MVDAMPGCAWGWLRPSRAVASRAAQAGGLGKREAAEPAPCLSHQPGGHRCGIDHLTSGRGPGVAARKTAAGLAGSLSTAGPHPARVDRRDAVALPSAVVPPLR